MSVIATLKGGPAVIDGMTVELSEPHPAYAIAGESLLAQLDADDPDTRRDHLYRRGRKRKDGGYTYTYDPDAP